MGGANFDVGVTLFHLAQMGGENFADAENGLRVAMDLVVLGWDFDFGIGLG